MDVLLRPREPGQDRSLPSSQPPALSGIFFWDMHLSYELESISELLLRLALEDFLAWAFVLPATHREHGVRRSVLYGGV